MILTALVAAVVSFLTHVLIYAVREYVARRRSDAMIENLIRAIECEGVARPNDTSLQ